jgi:predicted RNase H-like HicB family nuclease
MNKVAIDPARYPIEVHYSEEDGGFIALARDLPGCSAFGKTQARAVAEIRDAITAWQCAAAAANNPIPNPSRLVQDQLPSGRLLVRLPRSLHASLIDGAKDESISLNQYIVSLLSAGATVKQISNNLSRVWLAHAAFQQNAGATFQRFEISGPIEQGTVRPANLDLMRLPANQPVVQSER